MPPALRPYAATAAALAVAIGLVVGPVWGGQFVNWDDTRFLVDNPLFAEGGWTYVKAALAGPQFEAYQPVHLLSYLPDRYLWPDWPSGYRLISALLFGAALLLWLSILRRRVSDLAASLAVLFVALHPLAVESLVWITSRKDLLGLLFMLGALAVEDRSGDRDVDHRWPRPAGLALFALALLSKSATMFFPAVLAAWLVVIHRQPWRRVLSRVASYAVLALAAGAAVTWLWSEHGLIAERPLPTALDVPATIGFYLSKMVAPIGLSALYPRTPAHPGLLAGAAATIAIAAALGWRCLPALIKVACLGVVTALVPVSNIVPTTFRYADRYAIFALVFASMALAWLVERSQRRARHRRELAFPAVLVGVVVAVAMGKLSREQSAVWSSSQALWRDAVIDHPGAYMARLKLGETLREAGAFREAAAQYRAAVAIDDKRPLAYAGLLMLYAREAEAEGRLEPGTSERWLKALGPAMRVSGGLAALRDDALRSGCKRCALIAEHLRMKVETPSDAVLFELTEKALDSGARDFAAVYLEAVRDRSAERYRELARRAASRGERDTVDATP